MLTDKEIAREELIDAVEGGFADEGTIEWWLRKHFLTQEQKDFLARNDLSYSMIVNGRYECVGNLEQEVTDWMRSVNDTLDYKLFTTV